MAASKINSIAYFGDNDIDDTVLTNMKIAYYTELPKTYQSEHSQGFLCNMASQDFINIVLQRLKNQGAHQNDYMAIKIDVEDFKIAVINGKEHLIKTISGTDKIIVPWEDSFDIVWEGHKEHCHPDAPSLMQILQKKYLVNRNTIECLTKICPVCVGENRPSVKFNVDLVPITLDSDFKYNTVLTYEDTFTKYIQLIPIHKRHTIQELSLEVINVFLDFGPPKKILISHPVLIRIFKDFKDLFRKEFEFEIIVKRVEIDSYKINLIRSTINTWTKENMNTDWGSNIHNIEWILNNNVSNKDRKSANVRVFTANKKAATGLQTQMNVNLPSQNVCSKNDPVLSTILEDSDESMLSFSIEQDSIGLPQGPVSDDRDPIEFDKSMFEDDLEDSIYFDYNQFQNNEFGEGPSHQTLDELSFQPLEKANSKEVFTEDTPIVTNAETSSLALEAFTIATTTVTDSPPASEVLLFPEGSEHF